MDRVCDTHRERQCPEARARGTVDQIHSCEIQILLNCVDNSQRRWCDHLDQAIAYPNHHAGLGRYRGTGFHRRDLG